MVDEGGIKSIVLNPHKPAAMLCSMMDTSVGIRTLKVRTKQGWETAWEFLLLLVWVWISMLLRGEWTLR